ncbi:hypothetical protein SCUP234_04652 [Seiridium cupressi]
MDPPQVTRPYLGSPTVSADFASLLMPPSFPSVTPGDSSFSPTPPNFPNSTAWFYQQMPPNEMSGSQGVGLPNPATAMINTNRQEGGPFQSEDTEMSHGDATMAAAADHFIPNLRQIRELNSIAPYPSKNTSTDKENEEDKIIAAELASFTKVVFTAQSEIAGISLVLAEYLEWMRKAPKTFDHSSMLQKLESRAREVHDLARTRHYIAWKEMVAALETYRLGARLRELEGGVCRSLAELDRFFHAEYDVKCTLGDQRKSKRAESGPSSSNRSSSVASEDQLGNY